MIVLGITGGIGSGKTMVLKMLKDRYDAYVVEADILAHELMKKGNDIYYRIREEFGLDILTPEGEIDRARLGKIVFDDDEKLKKLNGIVHPAVKCEILRLIASQKENSRKLFVIEAALLIQDGYKEICDMICHIHADEETRVKRLMENRGYTKDRAYSVIASQYEEEFYIKNSDFVVDNSFSPDNTEKQIFGYIDKFYA